MIISAMFVQGMSPKLVQVLKKTGHVSLSNSCIYRYIYSSTIKLDNLIFRAQYFPCVRMNRMFSNVGKYELRY